MEKDPDLHHQVPDSGRAKIHFKSFSVARAGRKLENAGAGNLHLTKDERARIDEAFPLSPHYRGLPML